MGLNLVLNTSEKFMNKLVSERAVVVGAGVISDAEHVSGKK